MAQKLYTEEQVRKAMVNWSDCSMQDVIDRLTPIELPSDEEIYLEAEKYPYGGREGSKRMAFIEGAKWVINKILNK